MAGQKVRGVTIEVSADASKFNSGMKALRTETKHAQNELKELQKSLKLEYDEKTLKQAQKVAQEALDKTTECCDNLKARLSELEKAGKVDTDEYRKLHSELTRNETKVKELTQTIEELNQTKLNHLTTQINDFGTKIESAGKKMLGVSAVAGGALAGLAKLGTDAVAYGDDIGTMAVKYNTTAEAIQKMNYVALQTDVAQEQMYKGLIKVRSAIADIASGTTSTASEALQQLNLDINSFESTEECFYGVITALSNIENQTQMVAVANGIFGDKVANELIPIITSGSEAINQFTTEFEEFGYLTDEQITALGEFDVTMNALKTQMSLMAAEAGAALLPLMKTIASVIQESVIPAIKNLVSWFSSLSPKQQETMVKFLAIIAIAGPIVIAVGKMTQAVSSLIGVFGKLKLAQLSVAAGFASMLGAAALAFDMIGNWKNMSWVEKLLKSMALAALVAAAAVTVFHASWSVGIAIGAITAGIAAGIAAINAARADILPESESFSVSDFDASQSNFSTDSFEQQYMNDNSGVSSGNIYDNITADVGSGGTVNYDYSTTETTQNVTVVIENYANEVDVDSLVEEINRKLAEAL